MLFKKSIEELSAHLQRTMSNDNASLACGFFYGKYGQYIHLLKGLIERNQKNIIVDSSTLLVKSCITSELFSKMCRGILQKIDKMHKSRPLIEINCYRSVNYYFDDFNVLEKGESRSMK